MAVDLPNSGGGTTNYIRVATTPITGYPYTLHIRFNADSVADAEDSGGLIGLYDISDPRERVLMYCGLGGDAALKGYFDHGSANVLISTGTITAGTWYSAVLTEASSTSHAIWLNNSGTSDATSMTFSAGIDTLTCGRWDDSTPQFGFNGKLAEGAAWNVELTSAERQMLADGVSPLLVRPGSLRYYMPHVVAGVTRGYFGNAITEAGTVTTSAHPRTIYPPNVIAVEFAAAAASGVAPRAWHHLRNMHAA